MDRGGLDYQKEQINLVDININHGMHKWIKSVNHLERCTKYKRHGGIQARHLDVRVNSGTGTNGPTKWK